MSTRFLCLGVLALLTLGAGGRQPQREPSGTAARQEPRGSCGTVTGAVAALGPDLIVIRGAEPRPMQLEVGPELAVTVAGRPASREVLAPGMEVRATYQLIDGQPTAVSIDAALLSRPEAARPGSEPPPPPPPRAAPPTSPQEEFQPSPMETSPSPPPYVGPVGPLPLP
jgi:hypothetical protein